MSRTYSYYIEQHLIALKRDNSICQYCDERPQDPKTDHKIPRSQGGSHCHENLVCACNQCNSDKGHRTPQQWYLALIATPLEERGNSKRFGIILRNLETRFHVKDEPVRNIATVSDKTGPKKDRRLGVMQSFPRHHQKRSRGLCVS